jgi:hypothetical protein
MSEEEEWENLQNDEVNKILKEEKDKKELKKNEWEENKFIYEPIMSLFKSHYQVHF